MAKRRTSRSRTGTAETPGQMDLVEATSSAPSPSTAGGLWGILTNSGNLRDVFSRGCVVPANARKKHYTDLSDASPGFVPLLRSPIPEALLADVTSDASHLIPVFLVLGEELSNSFEPDASSLVFPGPIPLSLIRRVLFPSRDALDHFVSNPRRGQDSEGVALEVGLPTSKDAARSALPEARQAASGPGAGQELQRQVDSWAAVWALAASHFGAGYRHIAVTAGEHVLGGGSPGLALFPLGSRGLFGWFLPAGGTHEFTIDDHVTLFFLSELTRLGGGSKPGLDTLLESVLARVTAARLGSEDAAARLRRRLEQTLEALLAPGPDAERLLQEIRGAAKSFAMFILRHGEIESTLEHPGQYTTFSAEHRLAALFHAAWNGWAHLDKEEIPQDIRRLATHLACLRFQNVATPHALPKPSSGLPTDDAGCLARANGRDEAAWKKFAKSAGWDQCWQTTITMPDVAPTMTVKDGERRISFRGASKSKVKVTEAFDVDAVLHQLSERELDSKALKAARKRPRKRAAPSS